jgi:hypothetical protein
MCLAMSLNMRYHVLGRHARSHLLNVCLGGACAKFTNPNSAKSCDGTRHLMPLTLRALQLAACSGSCRFSKGIYRIQQWHLRMWLHVG